MVVQQLIRTNIINSLRQGKKDKQRWNSRGIAVGGGGPLRFLMMKRQIDQLYLATVPVPLVTRFHLGNQTSYTFTSSPGNQQAKILQQQIYMFDHVWSYWNERTTHTKSFQLQADESSDLSRLENLPLTRTTKICQGRKIWTYLARGDFSIQL